MAERGPSGGPGRQDSAAQPNKVVLLVLKVFGSLEDQPERVAQARDHLLLGHLLPRAVQRAAVPWPAVDPLLLVVHAALREPKAMPLPDIAVGALTRKRAELAAELEELERRARQLRADILEPEDQDQSRRVLGGVLRAVPKGN
jgi:hypothetical protein